jgi:hypothetical protein
MRLLSATALLIAFVVAIDSSSAQDKALTEKQKIEALIKAVEKLKDSKFVRNGAEYDAATAARFLRGKWESNAKEVKTAGDFIDKVGTSSGTTGKPYLIRAKDKSETKSRDFLLAELKKLESK